jgi:hypothetical protein
MSGEGATLRGRHCSTILLGLIPSNLVCCVCERRAVGALGAGRATSSTSMTMAEIDVAFFCPACAAREFGT